MAEYSLEPLTREQAIAAKERAFKKLNWPISFIGVSALGLFIAGYNVVNDPEAPAFWVASGICILVAAAGVLRLKTVAKRWSYRITRRNTGLGWLIAVPAALGTFALIGWGTTAGLQALGISIARIVGIIILAVSIFGAMVVAGLYWGATLLFKGDADGLFPMCKTEHDGSWDTIDGVVVTTAPGTVEIGLILAPGAEVKPAKNKPGEVLTDLPVRVLVPDTKFDLEAMKWALNQSGRTDVPLIERTPDGHQLLGYSNRWHEATATK
ncbi:hypothetical protein BST43_22450 [Mycobacteroides saopaulense]|uniref:Uncharacterized protein n=1 Tax=Mycobacteroides saopaulense TaxID=1578165 RepID=A0A1X0IPT4_9MYCO|nr:hypothetical protein [Mycobacteroides saopaulense]ORB50343.1 hypothetical protein BST43_22450 [Mycobacteroides saopaulense]